jgi:uncharacterized sulfatase
MGWFSFGRKKSGRTAQSVLVISVDDLDDTLGCYGHPLVQSPNIDSLAGRGMRFERAYCQYPLCNPSRASILTGLRPDSTRIFDNQTAVRQLHPNIVTLPQLFRNHGYFVARVGKVFHYEVPGDVGTSGLDDPQSWDLVINPKGCDKAEEHRLHILPAHASHNGALAFFESDRPDEEHTDGIVATETIRLLKEHRRQPFFLAAGFYRPHFPWIAPKKYFDLYKLESVTIPEVSEQDRAAKPAAAISINPPNYGLTDDDCRRATRAYYASISFMDAQVGKLLNVLDELGLSKTTTVMLWTDHGWHLGEHGLWKKMTLFEESTRVPLVFSTPGMKGQGKPCKRLVELVDLFPTLADVCGLPAPTNLEGTSFRPLLDAPEQPWKQAAFTQVLRGPIMGRTVCTEQYRYTEWDEGREGVELYDHAVDPRERSNLALDPERQPALREMQRLLRGGWKGLAVPSR